MRIGIFGGAFNPIHNGHLKLAEVFTKDLSLDKLLFIPTALPPHKTANYLASKEDRVNMLKLALEDNERYEISTIEFEREGKSYTYDTLLELKKIYPDATFYLIIGADQLLSFHYWYMYKEILDMVVLCSSAREDEEEKARLMAYANELNGLDITKFHLSKAPVIKVSSSQIRELIKNGEDASSLLPNSVYNYIVEKGLYNV